MAPNRRAMLHSLAADPFYARFARSAVGMGAAPLLTIAVTPVLTRLYSLPEWGVFAVFMGFVNVVNKVCCLNYDRAILIPDEESIALSDLLMDRLISRFGLAGLRSTKDWEKTARDTLGVFRRWVRYRRESHTIQLDREAATVLRDQLTEMLGREDT